MILTVYGILSCLSKVENIVIPRTGPVLPEIRFLTKLYTDFLPKFGFFDHILKKENVGIFVNEYTYF